MWSANQSWSVFSQEESYTTGSFTPSEPWSPSPYSFSNNWDAFANGSAQQAPKMMPQPVYPDFVQVSNTYNWKPSNTTPVQKPAATKPKQKTKKNPNGSSIEEEISGQNLYKTELCRSYEDTGSCRYGTKCQFAHGKEELRPVLRHPKYKTEICKTYYNEGTCPYGRRCRFIHSSAPDVSKIPVARTPKPISSPVKNSTSFESFSAPNVVPLQANGNCNERNNFLPPNGETHDRFSGITNGNSPWVMEKSPLPFASKPTKASSPPSQSWIEAMGSLSLSPSTEAVQLVTPEPNSSERLTEERRGSVGRLSFFESISNSK